jgi:GNAT superfamily N-acetyltransferase
MDDIDKILDQYALQGWSKPREALETYCREQSCGERVTTVALSDGTIAGYVTLFPQAKDAPPFRGTGIPEVKDFVVFKQFQKRGIGGMLMDRIESEAAKYAGSVCLGVGLHSGYGAAQRLYVKRGYIPDGSGVWDGANLAEQYAMVENGDDLVIYMSKKL